VTEIAERRSWLLIEKNVSAAKGPRPLLHVVHTSSLQHSQQHSSLQDKILFIFTNITK